MCVLVCVYVHCVGVYYKYKQGDSRMQRVIDSQPIRASDLKINTFPILLTLIHNFQIKLNPPIECLNSINNWAQGNHMWVNITQVFQERQTRSL